MLRPEVLARVCDALPPGFEPAARVRGRWRALPQVFRPRARGSKPSGSASQTRASNTLRNIQCVSYQEAFASGGAADGAYVCHLVLAGPDGGMLTADARPPGPEQLYATASWGSSASSSVRPVTRASAAC